MKKLFLSSFFMNVADQFALFAADDLHGKRVTFIPTAANVETIRFYVKAGQKALEKLGLITDVLDVSTATQAEISTKLEKNDYIYISGGNTFFLLQELIKSKADVIITEQVNLGKLYIGESAGSAILSPNIEYVKDMDNCSKAPELINYDALNLVDFYPLPHHTNFPYKKAAEKVISKYENQLPLMPFCNSQAITVSGTEIKIVG